jgi:hypothetical protein
MNIISNWIRNISCKFTDIKLPQNSSLEELKLVYSIYTFGINEFKECRLTMLDMAPPASIRKEHQDMIGAIKMFIDGTESMFSAIDLNERSVNRLMLDKGILMQNQGREAIEKSAKNIVMKFAG